MTPSLGIPAVFRNWELTDLPDVFSRESEYVSSYVSSIDKRIAEGKTVIIDVGDQIKNCFIAGFIVQRAFDAGFYNVVMLSAVELFKTYKESWDGADYYSELEDVYDLVALYSIDDLEFLGKLGLIQLNRFIEKRIMNKKATLLVGDNSNLSPKVTKMIKQFAVRIGGNATR